METVPRVRIELGWAKVGQSIVAAAREIKANAMRGATVVGGVGRCGEGAVGGGGSSCCRFVCLPFQEEQPTTPFAR
jgi:hypothetical protein